MCWMEGGGIDLLINAKWEALLWTDQKQTKENKEGFFVFK